MSWGEDEQQQNGRHKPVDATSENVWLTNNTSKEDTLHGMS